MGTPAISATLPHNKINWCSNNLFRRHLRVEKEILDDSKVEEVTNNCNIKVIYFRYDRGSTRRFWRGA